MNRKHDITWKRVSCDLMMATLPLPMRLNHVHVYAILAKNGWLLVDTGMLLADSDAIWETLLGALDAKVWGILITHCHPDHVGMANWLQQKLACPVFMSKGEYELLTRWYAHSEKYTKELKCFLHLAGVGENQEYGLSRMRSAHYLSRVSGIPKVQYIDDSFNVHAENTNWTCRVDAGHALAHISLEDKKGHRYLAGDFLLSGITPNISVYSLDSACNRLGDYLLYLEDRKFYLDADIQVFPGHGQMFRQGNKRALEIIQHHQARCDTILNTLRKGSTSVYALLPVLFKRRLGEEDLVFALGEAMAHVAYLYHAGQLEVQVNPKGVWRIGLPGV